MGLKPMKRQSGSDENRRKRTAKKNAESGKLKAHVETSIALTRRLFACVMQAIVGRLCQTAPRPPQRTPYNGRKSESRKVGEKRKADIRRLRPGFLADTHCAVWE